VIQMVSEKDVRAAARRLAGRVRCTPAVANIEIANRQAALKLEFMQYTGSFKVRGAFNYLLSRALPHAGVVAASGGNAGLAVAYASRDLGVPAEIFVPETVPAAKLSRLFSLGAQVTVVGANYAEALTASRRRAAESGAAEVHAYDDEAVAAGQGTVALEFISQVADLDTILVAVGGGGLIAGIMAATAARSIRIVGVEPETSSAMSAALAAGYPVDVEVSGVAADSLGARRVSELAFDVACKSGMTTVLVPDDSIVRARRALWRDARLVVEMGAATALAALVDGAYTPDDRERVGILLCGANTDPTDLTVHEGKHS
jgi:threonine dehydratase